MKWLDRITESWAAEHPDRDFSTLPPLVRLGRIALLMREYQKRVLKPLGLTPSDYTILGALRRSGHPGQLRPGDLYNAVGCSPGGLTKMIDRLERRGLVERSADLEDGRCFQIRLTSEGEALERRAFAAYVQSGRRLMKPLSKSELGQIDAALDLLHGCFEPSGEPDDPARSSAQAPAVGGAPFRESTR
jgi:DNA-binding MarR family transcriptional regulator